MSFRLEFLLDVVVVIAIASGAYITLSDYYSCSPVVMTSNGKNKEGENQRIT